MVSCSSKNNNILKLESDDFETNLELVQELGLNKNLINELLPINIVNDSENSPINKIIKNNIINILENNLNTITEVNLKNIVEENIVNKIIEDYPVNKITDLELKLDINLNKIKKYKKKIEDIYSNQNECIITISEEINIIFDERINKLTNLIENYNLKLKEIEMKLNM